MATPNLDHAGLLLALLIFIIAPAASAIGVNIGFMADNLPSPSAVATFLKAQTTIDRVKLFDSDPDRIRAFANSEIKLMITIPNGDIPALGDRHSGAAAAAAWIASNVSPYLSASGITTIGVGNEILAAGDKGLTGHLVPAMWAIHNALVSAGHGDVKVTTPHSLGILSGSDEPSTAHFRKGYDVAVFAPMLDFHRKTNTPFMVNPYPYFGYDANKLNYALFKPNAGVFDSASKVTYTNMFVAQLDAVYWAMKKLGYGDVEIAIGETGWPTAGDPGQLGVSVDDAASFNRNLIKVVESGKGTPMMPGRKFETYIFELFDENLKPGPEAERHWGMFRPDFSPVYDIGLLRGGAQSGGSSGGSSSGKSWCVANTNASPSALQANLDWACGAGGADCGPIKPGGACYNPNTLYAHASYAMNAYYQAVGRHSYNCDFGKTGVITSTDPSAQQCRYPA